jgi:hypothetical protein
VSTSPKKGWKHEKWILGLSLPSICSGLVLVLLWLIANVPLQLSGRFFDGIFSLYCLTAVMGIVGSAIALIISVSILAIQKRLSVIGHPLTLVVATIGWLLAPFNWYALSQAMRDL